MREIIFRGISIATGKWVYGDLIKSGKRCFIGDKLVVNEKNNLSTATQTFNAVEVTLASVEQYTGLKDRTGERIYEGDIIKVKTIIDDGQGGYYLDDEETIEKVSPFDYGNNCITWFPKDSEIIGDIHTTPELLEKKK